jgi:hypothetical protein
VPYQNGTIISKHERSAFMDKIYRNVIEDYTVPACCTFSKYVFGTLDDFKDIAEVLKNKDTEKNFTNAIDKYVAGERKIKYQVAYHDEQLMVGTKILYQKTVEFNDLKFTHINAWGFPYYFTAEKAIVERVLVQYRYNMYLIIKPMFTGLKIGTGDASTDFYVADGIWGYPGMYHYDEESNTHRCRLFLLENVFKSKTESAQAIDAFASTEIDFSSCFDEIVADG